MSQIGDNRVYTSLSEKDSTLKTTCPQCKVLVVPRGINSTRVTAEGQKHCPNCGHVFGRNELLPRKVQGIVVTAALNGEAANTIETDGGRIQLAADVFPDYADDRTVTWSIKEEEGEGIGEATLEGTLLYGVADGTATVIAKANDGSGVQGELIVTISNQVA
jgi:ribosomal protein S27AE